MKLKTVDNPKHLLPITDRHYSPDGLMSVQWVWFDFGLNIKKDE